MLKSAAMPAEEQRVWLAKLDERVGGMQRGLERLGEQFEKHVHQNTAEHNDNRKAVEKLKEAVDDSLRRIHARIDAGNNWRLAVAGTTILLLLGILGTLLLNGLPYQVAR